MEVSRYSNGATTPSEPSARWHDRARIAAEADVARSPWGRDERAGDGGVAALSREGVDLAASAVCHA